MTRGRPAVHGRLPTLGFLLGIMLGSALAAGPELVARGPFEFRAIGDSPDRFLLALVTFAACGGVVRVFTHWQSVATWGHRGRQVASAAFVGLVVSLFAWDLLRERPTLQLAISAAAGWLGGDILAQVMQVVVRKAGLGLDGKAGGP